MPSNKSYGDTPRNRSWLLIRALVSYANQDSELLETIQQIESSDEVKRLSSRNISWSGHRMEVQKVTKVQLRQLTNVANSLQRKERIDDRKLQETLDRMREIFGALGRYAVLDLENFERNQRLGVWNFALTLDQQDDDKQPLDIQDNYEQLRRKFEEIWEAGRKQLTEFGENTEGSNGPQGKPGELTQPVARDISQNPKQFDQPWQNQPGQSQNALEISLEDLVQSIREKVHADIQTRCGTMRVLDMEQPIELDDIYTHVNILKRISGRQRLGMDDLLQDVDPENFDRFLLGQVRHKRVPGIEAVERFDKLMVLGKPGAGKTTFLKRLATLCNLGEFEPQRVPVFVTLKDYAETPGKPSLQTYMQTQWQTCGVQKEALIIDSATQTEQEPSSVSCNPYGTRPQGISSNKLPDNWPKVAEMMTEAKKVDVLTRVLDQGKALILFDGLDEVQEADDDRILRDIKDFGQQFRKCQCVITCRIAAKEYTFEQFTEVEVADFDREQIAEFATKWFAIKQDPNKSQTFLEQLDGNKPIQELATTPILLTLLCLAFGETGKFPRNRAELYGEGVNLLLKKWDEKRNIKRPQTYKKLSPQSKKALLSQLAFETFERGDYFFKQAVVEHHIIQYIRSLPVASNDAETLQLDGEAVLKSIEAQHGLLVERARGVYSFSHLTFQEYFGAQYIISLTYHQDQALKNLLADHITDKRYQEIFILALEMLPEADTLLKLMKKQADQLMVDDSMKSPRLQLFLAWLQQKAASINIIYAPFVIRNFYLVCILSIDHVLDLDLHLDPVPTSFSALNFDRALVSALISALDLDHVLASANISNLASISDIDRILAFDKTLDNDFNRAFDCVLDRSRALTIQDVGQSVSELRSAGIQAIITAFTRFLSETDSEAFFLWWLRNSDTWIKELRSVIIENRNIGHDWQFSRVQKQKLKQYYEINKFLVNCLNSNCYVTEATRQYIEDTMLLPLSEIEKYPVPGRDH